jgi:hypothetical protein
MMAVLFALGGEVIVVSGGSLFKGLYSMSSDSEVGTILSVENGVFNSGSGSLRSRCREMRLRRDPTREDATLEGPRGRTGGDD